MPVNLVQSVLADVNASTSSSTLHLTFPNPVTAGNTLLVMGGGNPNFMFPASDGISAISDNVGDSFTTILNIGAPRNSGPVTFCYLVPSTIGGSSVIVSPTMDATPAVGGVNFPWIALAIEMSGMGSPTVQDKNSVNIFGSQGNTPVSTTINDSLGNTVTVTFNGTSGSGGPGTVTTVSAVDLLTGGLDFLFGYVIDQLGNNVPTANHGYLFTLQINATGPVTGMSVNYFTPGLPFGPGGRGPQIFVVT